MPSDTSANVEHTKRAYLECRCERLDLSVITCDLQDPLVLLEKGFEKVTRRLFLDKHVDFFEQTTTRNSPVSPLE